MDIHQTMPLLGGMSAQRFMRRHWQRKPLLIRQAIAGFVPPLDRAALFALAESEVVESRLIIGAGATKGWQMRQGPFSRRALPALKRPDWTLLIQGVDLHDQAVHELLAQFRFVPDARLDDVMVSYATEGGGVGPHFDSYDVFLLQALGQRRWRIGRQKDKTLQPGQPLKILQSFVAEQEFVLSPGDMLYLPPGYAHDGVALDECMTYSIGFRAPGQGEVAAEMLQRLAQDAPDMVSPQIYRDAGQDAVAAPGAIPQAMLEFARQGLEQALRDPMVLARNLGEHLTEPKPLVWFTEAAGVTVGGAVRLDRKTRMMYDQHHVFINGESYRAGGRDARLMHTLADARRLDARMCASVSAEARELLQTWMRAGWVHGD
jgi:50S ribosomal protein L16 3-hydroxylase